MKDTNRVKIMQLLKKYPLVIFLLGYMIIIQLFNPTFFSLENILDTLKSLTVLSLLSIPIMMVMLTNGIDVSGAAIAISSGYLSIKFAIQYNIESLWVIFLVAAGIGLLMGFINGLIIVIFNLSTLVVTLATQSIFQAGTIVLWGTKQINLGQLPPSLRELGQGVLVSFEKSGYEYGISYLLIPLFLISIITYLILSRTLFGRSVYAIGSSEEAARKVGINVRLTKMLIYLYSGLIAAIMGVVYSAQIGSVNPTRLVGLELTGIAAVILGGTRLTGGKGTVGGTIIGVLFIRILNKSLVLLGLSSVWNDFLVGFVLLLGIGVSSYLDSKKQKKLLIFTM